VVKHVAGGNESVAVSSMSLSSMSSGPSKSGLSIGLTGLSSPASSSSPANAIWDEEKDLNTQFHQSSYLSSNGQDGGQNKGRHSGLKASLIAHEGPPSSPTKLYSRQRLCHSLVIFTIVNAILWPLIVILVLGNGGPTSNSDVGGGSVESDGMASIFPVNWAVTGVRRDYSDIIALTGGTGPPQLDYTNETRAFIYYGTVSGTTRSDQTNSSSLHMFQPHFPGETVTASMLYGPNTRYFNPNNIKQGTIIAVGAYKATESNYQGSFIYEGPVNGSGTYTKLVFPPSHYEVDGVTYPDPPGLTVAHSTMGDFIVGNLYYQSSNTRGHGFIYNRFTRQSLIVDRGKFSTTLYGIWQNGGDNSTKYTIIGGHSDSNSTSIAFIENFDSSNNTFSNFTSYSYLNQTEYPTHFQGICGLDGGGFAIAAQQDNTITGAFVALYLYLPVHSDGSFGSAVWTPLTNTLTPNRMSTDTVLDDLIFGLYYFTNATGVQGLFSPFSSYISNVTLLL
jgi:hypothetical protein